MLGNIINALYWKKVLGNTAAGVDVTEIDGSAIDARGFDRALFILELGAVTNNGKVSFNIQESDDGTTFTDIEGAGFEATAATGKSDDTILVDVPVRQGYLRFQYQRTVASVEFDALQVALYDCGKLPVTQHSDVWQSITV